MSYQALLFCPDDKAARVVTQILTELEFAVEPSNEPFGAVKRLMAQRFDAVVVDCDNEQNAALLFKSARNSNSNQSSLAVAVVEGQAGVAKAFRIGANLVLTKPINVEQAKGTLRVARGLLRKGDIAKPPAGAAIPNNLPSSLSPAPIAQPELKRVSAPVPSAAPAVLRTPAPMAPPAAVAQVSSGFELSQEEGPQPEAAEAALIETMTESIPADTHAPASKPSREFAWQPVAKPNTEPMATALRRAADVVAKAEPHEAEKLFSAADATRSKVRSITSVTPSSKSPGAGLAPAREGFQPNPASDANVTSIAQSIPADAEEAEIPVTSKAAAPHHAEENTPLTFSSFDSAEEKTAGGGKKLLLIAVVLIVVSGAAYYVWSNVHKPTEPAQTQSLATPTPQPVASSTVDRVPSAAHETTVTEPVSGTPAPNTKPSENKSSAQPTAAAAKPLAAASVSNSSDNEPEVIVRTPRPIVVKGGSSVGKSEPALQEVEAPSASAVTGAGSTAKAISGIVSTLPTAMPSASRQSLKISQGVSEGLLLKKVSPTYPQQALQMRVQGPVQLLATIAKDGTITKVKTISGDSALARAANDAVKQWKYRPYLLNGEPVEIQTQITMVFKLP